MGRKSIFAALLLLLIMLAPHLVSASAISAPQAVSAESCVSFQYTFSVTNTNTDTRSYRITLDNRQEASSWVILEPKNFVLEAGQQKNILVFGRAPCQTTGKFPLTLTINDGDDDYVLKQHIVVFRQPNIAVVSEYTGLQSCPCTLQQFPVTVTNTRSYPEVYKLSVQDSKNFASVQPNRLILFPGQSQQVRVAVQPSCEYYGKRSIDLIVETENSGYKITQPLFSVVDYCYDYTATAPQQVDACLDEVTFTNITITNDMYFSNTYTFEGAPSWVQPQFESVQLPAGQSIVVPTVLIPQSKFSAGASGLEEGSASAEVKVSSKLGNTEAIVPFTVSLTQCRGLFIDIPKSITLCPDDRSIPFTLNNFGTKQANVVFELTGPPAFSLANGTLDIDGPSAQNLSLSVDHAALKPGVYDLTIGVEQQHNELIFDERQIEITATDMASCYQVSFSPKRLNLDVGPQNHTITVTQKGIKSAQYSFALNGTPWMSLQNATVLLSPGTEQTLTIITNAPEGVSSADAAIVAGAKGVAYVAQLSFLSSKGLLFLFLLALFILILIILIFVLVLLLRKFSGKNKNNFAKKQVKKENKVVKKKSAVKKKKVLTAAKKKKLEEKQKIKAAKKQAKEQKKQAKLLAKQEKTQAKAQKKLDKQKRKEQKQSSKQKQRLDKIKALSEKQKYQDKLKEEKALRKREERRHKSEMKLLSSQLRAKKKQSDDDQTITPLPVDEQDKLFSKDASSHKTTTHSSEKQKSDDKRNKKRKMIWWPLWLLLLILILLLMFWTEMGSTPINGTNETNQTNQTIFVNGTGVANITDTQNQTLPNQNSDDLGIIANETKSLFDRIKNFLKSNTTLNNDDIVANLTDNTANPATPNQNDHSSNTNDTEVNASNKDNQSPVSLFERLLTLLNADNVVDTANQTTQSNSSQHQKGAQNVTSDLISPLSQRQLDILLLQQTISSLPESLRESVQYQIITEGTQLTIDLSELFSDPDGGDLLYSAPMPQNITLDINGSILTIIPDPGFIGTGSTVFLAKDADGQIAQSPIINIIVVPVNLTQKAAEVRATYPDIDQILFDDRPAKQVNASTLTQVERTVVLAATWLLIIGILVVLGAIIFFSRKNKL